MRSLLFATTLCFAFSSTAWAFCGFYVAQEGSLFNDASKVVLARFGQRTSITMSSDVGGDPKEFALVIPVPTTIQRDQVSVILSATVDHMDAYTTPRLVEYDDPDPCAPPMPVRSLGVPLPVPAPSSPATANALGVRVEAEYAVGEYDIQVLSAGDSSGLVTYLNDRHYRIPDGAAPVIGSYLRQHMQFFVARVNMARRGAGSTFLRPLRVEYDSPKFMLPIRLGTVNARGPQDMIVLALSDRGRVEPVNYRTRRMPSGTDVPLFVRADFTGFYRAVFDRQVQDAGGTGTFLEYAWDLGACDPCSAPPLSDTELHELGAPALGRSQRLPFVTRMHVRYDRDTFPEDLQLQETADRESYQARFVVHQTFDGAASCRAGQDYRASLPKRFNAEARNVVELTDWSYDDVKARMAATGTAVTGRP